MSTKHGKHQIIFVKKGLLEIKLNRHKGCQLHLTENVLQDILSSDSFKKLFLQPLPKNINKNINRHAQVLLSRKIKGA